MKYFSKLLSMFLVGALLAPVGCTDYDEDIQALNNRIDQEILAGQIAPLKANLEKAVADLESAMASMQTEIITMHEEDVAALESADAALDGKIAAANESIVALENALATKAAALEKEIADLESALAAAKKEAADADVALEKELVNKINDLEKSLLNKISETKSALEGEIADLKEEMDKKVKEAEDAIAAANEDIAALDIRVTTLEEDVDTLEAQDEKFAEQLATIEESLEALSEQVEAYYNELKDDLKNLETKLQAQIDTNERNIAANAASIANVAADLDALTTEVEGLKSSIGTLDKKLAAHIEEFAAYQTKVAGEIALLNSYIEALNTTVNTLETETIPAMKEQIKANKELALQNAVALAENAAALEAYKSATNNTLVLLQDVDKALQTAITALGKDIDGLSADLSDLRSDLVDFQASVEDDLTNCFNGIADAQATADANTKSIAAMQANYDARLAALQSMSESMQQTLLNYQTLLNEEIANRTAAVAALDSKFTAQIATANEAIEAVEKEVEELNAKVESYKEDAQKALNAAVDALGLQIVASQNAAQEYADTKVNALRVELTDKMVKDIAAAKQELTDALNSAKKALEDQIAAVKDELNKRCDSLASSIEEILNRIQSVVFVPEYTDGCATISYAKFGGQIIEGRYSYLTYQVYPADCATDLMVAFANGNNPFSFNIKGVKTRANEPSIVVNKVLPGENGELKLHVSATNLGDDFYTTGGGLNNDTYAVSLVISDGKANLSSAYTNLAAASTPGKIGMKIMLGENDITNQNPYGTAWPTAYTKINEEYVPLKDHKVVYTFVEGEVNRTSITAEELKNTFGLEVSHEAAYAVEPVAPETLEAVAESVTVLMPGDEGNTTDYIKAYLNDVVASNVGSQYRFTYTYTAGDITVNTGADWTITPVTAELTLPAQTITWNYEDDAAVDAARIAGDDTLYSRPIISFALDQVVKNGEWPADMDVVDVLASTPAEIIVKDGLNADLAVNADGQLGTIALYKFEWGKTYEFTLRYVFSNVGVTATLNVTTVDRAREAVTVDLGATDYEYTKDLKILGEEISNELSGIYDAITYDLNEMGAEAYLTDIFVTNPWTAENHINEKVSNTESWTTNLSISEDGQKAYAHYTYLTKFADGIPSSLVYTKNITTWYGQEITLTKTVNFTLPTYDFAHSRYYVTQVGNRYQSQVQPTYKFDPQYTNALKAFSVVAVNMNNAFNVVDAEGSIISDLEAQGLQAVFSLEGTHGAGITIADNMISYLDSDNEVEVHGELRLVNSDDSYVTLPTKFDEGGAYSNYVVTKYDPIQEPTSEAAEIMVTNATKYVVNVRQYVSLNDFRQGYTNYPLISNGEFVTGDNTNGFATGVSATDLYGLQIAYNVSEIPVEFAKYVSFNATSGELTFDNSAQLDLVEPIEFTVNMTVKTTWGDHSTAVKVIFKNGYNAAE